MNNTRFRAIVIAALGLALAGCSASITTNTNTSKPANTNASPAASPAANKPAASNSNSGSTSESKPKLQNEKKPEGTAKTAKKEVPVPADWIYVYDEKKGYGFSVPDGTTGESTTASGIDVMGLTTPSGIDIWVLAYKNKELTKEDLLNDAVEFLTGLGQKVTPGNLKAESDDYAVADAKTVLGDRKGQLRILVGTDVTDNYVMILGTDESKFASNEKIIDEIWGSFEMWSGGASNN